MPFCPECLAEYREGFTRCSTCEVDLVDQLPEPLDLSEEAIRQALEGQDLVPVTRGTLDVVKETQGLLSNRRIASLIVDDEDAPVQPGMPKRVLLVVGKDDLEAAAGVLGQSFQDMLSEEGLQGPDLQYDKCPACGHALAVDQEECPECGLFVGSG
jgi:uncharacterized protein YbaR (Trm112 family)